MTCDQVRNDISSLNIWSGGYDGGYDELLPFVGKSCVDAFIEPIMYLVNESLKMPICPIIYTCCIEVWGCTAKSHHHSLYFSEKKRK